MNNDLITQEALNEWLSEHSDWQVRDGALYRTMALTNFSCAMHPANQIAVLAEQQDHHPQLNVSWGSLEIFWVSHDVKGISQRDVNLALMTDRALQEYRRKSHAA